MAKRKNAARPNCGVYVYGIVRAAALQSHGPIRTAPIGAAGNAVRALVWRNLAALVSDALQPSYDVSRENVMAHEKVLEEILGFTDVVPAQFGLVSANEAVVRQTLLQDHYVDLRGMLAHVTGRVELGLKVLWQKERVLADIVAQREDIRELRDETTARGPESAYYERIRLGQLVEAALEQLRRRDIDEMLAALTPLSVAVKTNRLLNDMMVLNGAFLVEKEHEPTFDLAVNEIAARNAGRLTFKYVGPLPPFDFVDLGWKAGH